MDRHFVTTLSLDGAPGDWAQHFFQRPVRMLADYGVLVRGQSFKHRTIAWIAAVAHGHRHVAEKFSVARSQHRDRAEHLAEFGFVIDASSSSGGGASPQRGAKAGSEVDGARRFQGQTS